MRKWILPIVLTVTVGIIAFLYGKYAGVMLVRNGLVANYPTVKNLINRAYIEVDSIISFPLVKDNDPALSALFEREKRDTIYLSIPFHAKYGVDVNSHFYKITQDGNDLEVFLPATHVLNYSISANYLGFGKNDIENGIITHMVENELPIQLERIKSRKAQARQLISETLMFYFIPYKFNMRMYFDNIEYPLPQVPGLNKNIDDYIQEQVGKK